MDKYKSDYYFEHIKQNENYYDSLIQKDISSIANTSNFRQDFSWALAPNTCYNFKDNFAQKQIEELCKKIEELENRIEYLEGKH